MKLEFDWTKTEKGNDINSEGVCSGREEMESSIRDLCRRLSLDTFDLGKMTGLNFRSVQKSSEATIFQKYPIVWWSNFIVISILIVSTWLYFIMYRTNVVEGLLNLSTEWVVIISVVIMAIIIAAVLILCKKCNSENNKK